MQNPEEEISQVIKLLTTAVTPDLQQATVEKFFTPDAEFSHPLCRVTASVNSRAWTLGIYQWYRIMSPKVLIDTHSVIHDRQRGILITDSTQLFHIRWNPFPPKPSRLLTRITLRESGSLYYISKQEDFYHPDEFCNLVLPPLTPLVVLFLYLGTLLSKILAWFFQNTIGWWKPSGQEPLVTTVDDVGFRISAGANGAGSSKGNREE